MARSPVLTFDSRLLDEREPPALQQKNVAWLLGAGFVLLALGAVALMHLAVIEPRTVISFGIVLVFAGLIQGLDAWLAHARGVSLLDMVEALLYVGSGIALAVAELASSIPAVSLLFGVFLLIDGLIRSLASGWYLPKKWIWSYVHGVVSFLTGFLLLVGWPIHGLPALALYLGMDLTSAGVTLIAVWSAVQDLDPRAPADGVRGAAGGT